FPLPAPPSLSHSHMLSLPLYRYFFLPLYHDHHSLHSFPTRRSSDLHNTGGYLLATDAGRARWGARCAHRGRRHDYPDRCRKGSRDRKSTRLNSSHQIISYAVFCLKKKNTKTTRV